MSILYVDDDHDIRLIVEMALRLDPAIDLRAVASGPAAMTMIDAGGWRPDVILLDVMMPDMSGPEILSTLRLRHCLAGVPALFITARARELGRSTSRRDGVVGVIAKPFDPLALAAQIRTLTASRVGDPVRRAR